MKRSGQFIIITLVLGLIGVANAAESKPNWQREWEKVLQGAKREGEVRLWGEQEITHPDIIAAFTKEFPFVKAVSVSGRVGDLMPRIIAERRAGKFLADVYSGGLGGRSFYDFHKAGVLDPLKPLLLSPDVVDGSKWLNGEHYYADSEKQFVFMYEGSVAGVGLHYNTNLVDLKEFKSYLDLLSPKWKGKILLFERPGVGSPSVIRYFYNTQLGPDFVKRLFSEMEVTVSQDRRQSSEPQGSELRNQHEWQQRLGAHQQCAESKHGASIHQLVSLPGWANRLADRYEYKSAGAVRFHARRYSQRQSCRAGPA